MLSLTLRPSAAPQENFKKTSLFADTGRWRYYDNGVGLEFRVRFVVQHQNRSATDCAPAARPTNC
jgi:hypothetical protein